MNPENFNATHHGHDKTATPVPPHASTTSIVRLRESFSKFSDSRKQPEPSSKFFNTRKQFGIVRSRVRGHQTLFTTDGPSIQLADPALTTGPERRSSKFRRSIPLIIASCIYTYRYVCARRPNCPPPMVIFER